MIYVLPLAAIVAVFAGTLGVLLLAPERVSQPGITFGLMALAVLVTLIAARLTRSRNT